MEKSRTKQWKVDLDSHRPYDKVADKMLYIIVRRAQTREDPLNYHKCFLFFEKSNANTNNIIAFC